MTLTLKTLVAAGTVALSTSLISAPVAAQETLFTIPVTKEFSIRNGRWTNGSGRTFTAWRILNRKGQNYVCGAIASDKHSSMTRHSRAILRKGYVKVEGKKIMRGLAFFTVAEPGTDIMDAKATCKPFSAQVPAGAKYRLGYDPVRVRG
ncbi:hypothetical protein J7443_23025 [Tropicibacter sp. R15_0]|uniref:hypothetical protein n=1 Tax=Tropicibacter sp. R15_0 TaxID=2821101 RepID=UPI001ADC820F|nr:hypothetical protein [Tropicibacter sp. R15_0]MBO9468117.1 hypothetical protein [Tropicibacter sp. R15_0]